MSRLNQDAAYSGTDGSDHAYRQTIADRYRRLVGLRTTIKQTAFAQLIYVCTRTAWKAMPMLVAGSAVTITDEAIFAFGVLLFLLYRYAFGFGKPQNERQWAIQVYSVGSMFLAAECFLTFWIYHVMRGAKSLDPAAAAAYPPIPKAVAAVLHSGAGLSAGVTGAALAVLDFFEKAFEVVGLAACATGVYMTKEYVLETREQRREAEERRAGGVKKE